MNYYVLAVDGKTYGPVDLEGLRQWVREGRIVAGTRLREVTTGREVLASEVAELQGLFVAGRPQSAPAGSPYFSQCPHCGGAMGVGQAQCGQCGTVLGYGHQPRTLITGSLTGDRIFGFLVGFFSVFLWGIGAFAALILYFALRRSYPIFSRSLGFGLFTLVVLFLGLVAVCFVGLSSMRW